MHLYKILTLSEWRNCLPATRLKLPSSDSSFIHLSEEKQLSSIVKKYFIHEKEIVILKLDSQRLEGKLVKEKNPGGSQEYYHLYDGAIPLEAVIDVKITPPDAAKFFA